MHTCKDGSSTIAVRKFSAMSLLSNCQEDAFSPLRDTPEVSRTVAAGERMARFNVTAAFVVLLLLHLAGGRPGAAFVVVVFVAPGEV